MPLHAGTLQAEAPVAAAGAVGPREVPGLADDLPARLAGAPELGAVLHVGAGLGAHPESQLALLVQAVAAPWQVFGQRDGFGRLVQQAVSCGVGDGGVNGALGGCRDQRGEAEHHHGEVRGGDLAKAVPLPEGPSATPVMPLRLEHPRPK